MKRVGRRFLAVVISIAMVTVSANCRTDGKKPGGAGGSLEAYAMETVHARTKDTPPKSVIIELSLYHRDGAAMKLELEQRKDELKSLVGAIIREKHHFEMYKVDDYEALHVIIRDTLNKSLKSGSVEKVFFRNFEIR